MNGIKKYLLLHFQKCKEWFPKEIERQEKAGMICQPGKQGSSCTENVNCCFYNAEKPVQEDPVADACFCVRTIYELIVRFTQKESNEIVHNAGFVKNIEKSL